MGQDISGDVSDLIAKAKVFGASDNIRHGTYVFVIRRIFAELVETDLGNNRMGFWELSPIESKPNPQTEGDHVDYPGVAGPLKDDGNNPNPVGSNCALKVNFDGPGGRSAGSNLKSAILALFGKRDGEISDAEIAKTWIDLSRQRDLRVGDAIGIDAATNQPIYATAAKRANPACGMLIACTTMVKKKRTPNDKGAYITKLVWSCVSPPGVGQNAPELVAKRRAEIEASFVDDEEETPSASRAPSTPAQMPISVPSVSVPSNGTVPAGFSVASAPPTLTSVPPSPPPAPPPPVTNIFAPPPPWEPLPGLPAGPTPETRWFWSNPSHGGSNLVKNEAQLRNGQ